MVLENIHTPVMLTEVLKYIEPKDEETYLDATFGAGGHSREILAKANCKILALDRDPDTESIATELEKENPKRVEFIQGCFGNVKQLLKERNIEKVDGILIDAGVSSMQINNPERGFSFMRDGPLDMRMSKSGLDASYVINNMKEEDLANIIYKYGDERKSRKIAGAIVKARQNTPFTRTLQLAEVIRSVMPYRSGKIDSATRTFQAIRIYINGELEELEAILNASEDLLSVGGRIVVITFHSLEDKIVKSFLRSKDGRNNNGSRYLFPYESEEVKAVFKVPVRKVIRPSEEEVSKNVRARSSRLRFAIKI